MDLLLQMIDEAFLAVVDSFSRKAKAELAALEKLEFQYNDKVSSDNIHDTIVVYKNNEAVACGGLTMYSEDRAELVDIYVEPEYENFGLEAEIVRRLEAKAKIKGYNWCVVKLNTGRDKVLREVSSSIESSELISTDKLAKDSFNETYNLYKRAGYRLMPDFGEYSEISDCLYLERKI